MTDHDLAASGQHGTASVAQPMPIHAVGIDSRQMPSVRGEAFPDDVPLPFGAPSATFTVDAERAGGCQECMGSCDECSGNDAQAGRVLASLPTSSCGGTCSGTCPDCTEGPQTLRVEGPTSVAVPHGELFDQMIDGLFGRNAEAMSESPAMNGRIEQPTAAREENPKYRALLDQVYENTRRQSLESSDLSGFASDPVQAHRAGLAARCIFKGFLDELPTVVRSSRAFSTMLEMLETNAPSNDNEVEEFLRQMLAVSGEEFTSDSSLFVDSLISRLESFESNSATFEFASAYAFIGPLLVMCPRDPDTGCPQSQKCTGVSGICTPVVFLDPPDTTDGGTGGIPIIMTCDCVPLVTTTPLWKRIWDKIVKWLDDHPWVKWLSIAAVIAAITIFIMSNPEMIPYLPQIIEAVKAFLSGAGAAAGAAA